MLVGTRRALLGAGKKLVFLIRDEFTIPRAAGAVDGTPASHKGERLVTDTGDHAIISAGRFSWDGVVGAGDPGLWYVGALTRTVGLAFIAQLTSTSGPERVHVGFDNDQAGHADRQSLAHRVGIIRAVVTGTEIIVGAHDTSAYTYAIPLRASGAFYCVKGGAFTDWTLLWVDASEATATLYPAITAAASTASSDFLRVAQLAALWSNADDYGPATNAAAFLAANGTALSALVNARGGAFVHDPGIWDVQGNAARGSPAAGVDVIVNGTFTTDSDWTKGANITIAGGLLVFTNVTQYIAAYTTVAPLTKGDWYQWSIDIAGLSSEQAILQEGANVSIETFSSDGTYTGTYRSTQVTPYVKIKNATVNASFTADNVSFRPLTLSELFSSVADSGLSDCHVIATIETLLAGTQAGVVMCLDSAASPANFIILYHDGTNAIMEKCVAGVYTTLVSVVAAYSAGARIIGIKDGNSISMFYNEALIGTTQTVSDAGITSNQIHGVFSTHVDNRLDNFQVHPYDLTGAEAAELTRYAA